MSGSRSTPDTSICPAVAADLLCTVVSPVRETGRRTGVSAALERLGIEAELLDAVDATDGFDPAADARIRPSRPAYMTAGECACALSHALAYRRFLTPGRVTCSCSRTMPCRRRNWLASSTGRTTGRSRCSMPTRP